jgi:importin subunit beta-1
MASVICKNLILNKGKDERYEDIWLKFDPQFKSFMKEAILTTLASSSSSVRSSVASLIATISAIEIPRKEWEDLIPKLCQGAQNVDISGEIRLASL